MPANDPADALQGMAEVNRRLWSQWTEMLTGHWARQEGAPLSDYYRLGLGTLQDLLHEGAKAQNLLVDQWFTAIAAAPALPEPVKQQAEQLRQQWDDMQRQQLEFYDSWLEQARQLELPATPVSPQQGPQDFMQLWQGLLQQAGGKRG